MNKCASKDHDPHPTAPSPVLSQNPSHLCPLSAGLVDIKNGGHWWQPLARSLLPEPRGLETIGQGHHNSPKLVFDIFLGREKMDVDTRTIPGPQPCPKLQPDLGEILKFGNKPREIKERGGE